MVPFPRTRDSGHVIHSHFWPVPSVCLESVYLDLFLADWILNTTSILVHNLQEHPLLRKLKFCKMWLSALANKGLCCWYHFWNHLAQRKLQCTNHVFVEFVKFLFKSFTKMSEFWLVPLLTVLQGSPEPTKV